MSAAVSSPPSSSAPPPPASMPRAPIAPTTTTTTATRRYEPLLKIASGGTASVWVGAAAGAHGFRQLVAIKRPHEHLADDPAFVEGLIAEAKIASRLRHANAVDVRDIEVDASGVQLVMDWVEGASLSDLIRAWQNEPPPRAAAVALRVVLDACEGLRALHELQADDGSLLGCVHRDVSPANILVGLDGLGRITDFGLARPLLAIERTTSQGALRGKLGYMAPEYIRGKEIDHRVDVFATAVVLWEALARKRLFRGENDADTLDRVQREAAPRLIDIAPRIDREAAAKLDALLERALAKDPNARIGSIADLAKEIDQITREHDLVASHGEVRDSFGTSLRTTIDERRREVQRALAATFPAGDAVSNSTSISAFPSPNTSPQSPIALRLAGAENLETPASQRKRQWFFVAIGVAMVGAVISLSALSLYRSLFVERVVNPSRHTVEPDVQPRGDDVRGRDATPAAATTTSSPASSSRPTHRASAASSSDGKAPRPNPYANAPR